jgi:hypothetical protein
MKRKKIVTFAAVGIVGIAFITCALAAIYHYRVLSATRLTQSAKPEAVPASEIPARDVSSQVSAMQQWVTEVNTPKDAQLASYVTAAVQQAGQLWQEWQTLVNSGEVRIKPWQGTNFTSGVWESPDGKTKISLIFRSKERQIIHSKKRIYSPEGKVEQFYWLAYYDDSGTIKHCELDSREVLLFYPGNKISSYARKVDPAKEGWETWYEIEWDENGKIVREQTRTYEIPQAPASS